MLVFSRTLVTSADVPLMANNLDMDPEHTTSPLDAAVNSPDWHTLRCRCPLILSPEAPRHAAALIVRERRRGGVVPNPDPADPAAYPPASGAAGSGLVCLR